LTVSKNKSALTGQRFQDTEDIQKYDDGIEGYSTTGIPKMFPTVHHWAKNIAAHGEYLKGDPSQ
jgi:hypothetical protein